MKLQFAVAGLAVAVSLAAYSPDAWAGSPPALAPGAARATKPVPRPSAAKPRARLPDYSQRERRLAALLVNAEARDVSGDTQRDAAAARAVRARCTTAACFERSYAAQEAELRRWDGADGIIRQFGGR